MWQVPQPQLNACGARDELRSSDPAHVPIAEDSGGAEMAYLGVDPWRRQYFAPVPCPRGIDIPVDEASAWRVHPEFRHVHNKLWICQSQGLAHGPHGVTPPSFPVFSKPIYNMRGMGTGSRVLRDAGDYRRHLQPGHMWMPLFTGAHVSTDLALAGGRAKWIRHTTGIPRRGGTFDRWIVHAERMPELERRLARWARRGLQGFTGIANVETIGGRIIECHLRMAEQWLDLNGEGWLAAVTGLYRHGTWKFDDARRRTGYSVVLFAPHGRSWRVPPRATIDRLRARPDIASIQITFDPRRTPATHAMPPGGFRLAIVNCWNLAAGRRVRRELAQAFGV
ncbi:MAG: hypothetical protein GC202_08965 [Alphaproteobacteria bacterium]|nr:hypothetical protein [Alphaproteobacteria bacterium]